MLLDRSLIANRLLAALPRAEYQRLLPNLQPVTLTFGEVLYEPGGSIKHVYFPNDSHVSLLTPVDRHHALEVGLVGYEGMVGIALALGIGVSSVRALVQGNGDADEGRALSQGIPAETVPATYAGCAPGWCHQGSAGTEAKQTVLPGNIAITNRRGLEAVACSCYQKVKGKA